MIESIAFGVLCNLHKWTTEKRVKSCKRMPRNFVRMTKFWKRIETWLLFHFHSVKQVRLNSIQWCGDYDTLSLHSVSWRLVVLVTESEGQLQSNEIMRGQCIGSNWITWTIYCKQFKLSLVRYSTKLFRLFFHCGRCARGYRRYSFYTWRISRVNKICLFSKQNDNKCN